MFVCNVFREKKYIKKALNIEQQHLCFCVQLKFLNIRWQTFCFRVSIYDLLYVSNILPAIHALCQNTRQRFNKTLHSLSLYCSLITVPLKWYSLSYQIHHYVNQQQAHFIYDIVQAAMHIYTHQFFSMCPIVRTIQKQALYFF